MKDDLWNRLTALIGAHFGAEPAALRPETTAEEVEGWDSVSHIAFLGALERELGVRFHTGEMADLTNVGDLFARVSKAVARAR